MENFRSKADWRYWSEVRFERLGVKNMSEFDAWIVKRYQYGKSGPEIAEDILEKTGIPYDANSVRARLRENGIAIREMGEAFRNAVKRGRVHWQLREDYEQRARGKQISRKLRMEILERDGFACSLCGNGKAQGAILQVDHIVAKMNGGTDDEKNLRTLCIACNEGKRDTKKERRMAGNLQSGRSKKVLESEKLKEAHDETK